MSRGIPVIFQASGSDRFESLTPIPLSGHVVGGTARRACCEFATPRLRATAYAAIGCALTVFLLAGCYQPLVLPQSDGHITTPAAKPTLADIPPPARVTSFLPEPRPAIKRPTYSVVVDEVPVKALLLALARDTGQNIDIHPALTGLVSLNAINETLAGILDRMAKQVNLRYRQIGNTLEVTPDRPYSKTYKINYVNMVRNSNSTTSVSGRIGGAPVQRAPVQRVAVQRRGGQLALRQHQLRQSPQMSSGRNSKIALREYLFLHGRKRPERNAVQYIERSSVFKWNGSKQELQPPQARLLLWEDQHKQFVRAKQTQQNELGGHKVS